MATFLKDHNQNLLPPADWAGEIDNLREGLRTERDRNLRTLADFKNYRRRIEREGNKIAEEGKREIVLPLLDIIDDMERALEWASDTEQPLVRGVRIIHKKLLTLLEAQGVLPFESTRTLFNPDVHDAVALVDAGDHHPGTVVDEIRRGYLWKGQLLRPAQVRVAR